MNYILPPELQKLTEAEVEKAIADINNHEVINALNRLADIYASQYASFSKARKNPDLVLNQKTSCAIEKLALEMTAAAIRSSSAKMR